MFPPPTSPLSQHILLSGMQKPLDSKDMVDELITHFNVPSSGCAHFGFWKLVPSPIICAANVESSLQVWLQVVFNNSTAL